MRLIDAHTHLNTTPLVEDWQGYLQTFVDVGGVGLINSGADEQYNLKGIEIAKIAETMKWSNENIKTPLFIKTTLGWHPLECVEGVITAINLSKKMQWLKNLYLINKEYVVAIGETGIDLHYPHGFETLEIQKKLFIAHCQFARETGLPLVVHSRDAFTQTLEILHDYKDLTIYFHCWGYTPQEFNILYGEFSHLFIGFCGNVTYKKADDLRETLKLIPLEHLLLETDAPYLSPQVVRGAINHPANVQYIYDYVADYLQLDKEFLAQQIEQNFKQLYIAIGE